MEKLEQIESFKRFDHGDDGGIFIDPFARKITTLEECDSAIYFYKLLLKHLFENEDELKVGAYTSKGYFASGPSSKYLKRNNKIADFFYDVWTHEYAYGTFTDLEYGYRQYMSYYPDGLKHDNIRVIKARIKDLEHLKNKIKRKQRKDLFFGKRSSKRRKK